MIYNVFHSYIYIINKINNAVLPIGKGSELLSCEQYEFFVVAYVSLFIAVILTQTKRNRAFNSYHMPVMVFFLSIEVPYFRYTDGSTYLKGTPSPETAAKWVRSWLEQRLWRPYNMWASELPKKKTTPFKGHEKLTCRNCAFPCCAPSVSHTRDCDLWCLILARDKRDG